MSNIEIVRKNLGPVTAYKYAVQQGYTGTEQEFAALMASYATVAEEAEAAKDDAVDAKTAAEAAQAAAEEAARTLTIDDTLSESGQAADAKATGRIKDDLTAVVEFTNKPVLAFIQGRYITIGDPVGTTSSSGTTVSTQTAIPYTDVAYNIFVKSGWQLAFPSFTSGNLSSAAKTFIVGPATVTIEDIKANVYNAGESFAIMVRTDPGISLPVSGFSAKDAFVFMARPLTIDSVPTQGSNNAVSSGGVYETIGVLKEDLDGLRTHPTLTWEIGKNIGATGSLQNNQYMALTKPIPVDSGDVIVRTAQAKDTNNNTLVFYVNTYNQTTWIARTELSYGQSYTIPNNITAIRIGFGRISGTGVTMTQGDVDTYFSADFYTWSLVAKQRTTVLGTSFAENTKIGVYNFGGHTIAPYKDMTDVPSDTFGGGCMIVLPAGSYTVNRLQIIYDLVNLKAYRRYLSYNSSTASYTVGDWAGFDFDAPFVLSKTLDTSATLLSQNTDVGLYRVGSFAQEPMATYIANGDYPDAKYGGGWMLVLPAGGSNGVCQVVYDVVNGYINSRYISGNSLQNVGAWNAGHGIKWAAIGDSITYGVYSTGADSSAVDRYKCYAKRIANLIGAEVFDNFGVRGLGYINSGNNGETLKDDVIDSQDINWTDYNLITVALGVNDYYGNRIIGAPSDEAWSETVYGSIRGTIESLLAHNPKAKLIFITPFNMAKSGSLSTHWGKGYAKSKIGTLNDVKNAIIYWCDYYGVEYINETDYSVINDINITTLLPDSLHPSANAHALIARELAKKINFS